ncbi:MAG: tetratricopeptide repeat protein [Methylobacter sp.]|nr:tetratricopeptide repeat protein [Methylobacter sp.]
MSFLLRLTEGNIKKLGFAAAFIAVIAAGGWVIHRYGNQATPLIDDIASKQLIVQGENALNIGHYDDAIRIFEEELKINPQNQQAAWDLKKAQARETSPYPAFKQTLDSLYQQNPNDAHVNLFLGEFYAANHEWDLAIAHYEHAIKLNPRLAEAYFDLSVLYDQQGYLNDAKVEILKAIAISSTPKYRNSLATIYFKQKRYEEAIREYGKNLDYPLSALQSAKIYLHLDFLSQALSHQRQAILWLENETVMNRSENQEPWYFDITPEKRTELVKLDEKKGYAYFCLSVSMYLQGNTEGAENEVKKMRDLNVANQTDINNILKADLDALMQANNNISEQVEAYKKLYL